MNDTIATVERPETHRTEYRDGGVLSAAALAGDSASNIGAREKHQATAHTGGIVAGLVVTIGKQILDAVEKKVVKVSPGAAIDTHGRMLLVAADFPRKDQPAGDFAVWLRYAAVECSDELSDLRRLDETPRLDLPPLTEPMSARDPVDSDGVLLAIVRNGVVEECCRRYVGAVGSRIVAPSKRARVVLGPQFPRDSRRFAIGVQADPAQPIRDVVTWESTGTIRLSATNTVARPPEKPIPNEGIQPPTLAIGSPTVNVTTEDILDPCGMRDQVVQARNGKMAIHVERLRLLSPCEQHDFQDSTICRDQLTSLLVRILNRLIRQSSDDIRDAAQPVLGAVVWDENEVECTITKVGYGKCDINASGVPRKDVDLKRLKPREWLKLWQTVPNNDLLSRLLPLWRSLPGDYLCRIFLDGLLEGTLRSLAVPPSRGLFFSGAVPVDPEPSASRIHLVDFKKDGETFRQLRITIPDPGKENSPHRYRCSIGTAICNDPPAPLLGSRANIWNRQTSLPRGILSVLADKSIDIHNVLSVYAREGTLDAGLVLKLEPAGDAAGAASGSSTTSAGGSSIPPTPILGNAVVWEGQKANRTSPLLVVVGGSLRNLTDVAVESLQVLVSIYGKNVTGIGPSHKVVVSDSQLGAKSSMDLTTLAGTSELKVDVPNAFKLIPVVVSLLVLGVNRHNAIICTQYTEEHS